VFEPEVATALRDITAGDHLMVLTWFDRADREILEVHPRSDPNVPLTGVFSTRSPDRPNPIGLHPVVVLEVSDAGLRLRVSDLEALDGTPVVDVKAVLTTDREG
jgi:tRNA-Thr(GGU) m(6)t(6)A37 methyltransferase TsaA